MRLKQHHHKRRAETRQLHCPGMDKRSHPGWFAMLGLVEIVRNQKGGDASSAAAAKILVRELGESAPAPTEA